MVTEKTAEVKYTGLLMCSVSSLWLNKLPGSRLPFKEGAIKKLDLKA